MSTDANAIIDSLAAFADTFPSVHDENVVRACIAHIQTQFLPKERKTRNTRKPTLPSYKSSVSGDIETVVLRGVSVVFNVCDSEIFHSHRWWTDSRGYVMTQVKTPEGKRRTIGLHRLIMGDHACDIDHINRNPSDNTRENLRLCSRSENCKNTADRKGKTSRFRGVSKSRGKWVVVVRIDGKVTWLGSFDTEEQAAAVAAPYFSPTVG